MIPGSASPQLRSARVLLLAVGVLFGAVLLAILFGPPASAAEHDGAGTSGVLSVEAPSGEPVDDAVLDEAASGGASEQSSGIEAASAEDTKAPSVDSAPSGQPDNSSTTPAEPALDGSSAAPEAEAAPAAPEQQASQPAPERTPADGAPAGGNAAEASTAGAGSDTVPDPPLAADTPADVAGPEETAVDAGSSGSDTPSPGDAGTAEPPAAPRADAPDSPSAVDRVEPGTTPDALPPEPTGPPYPDELRGESATGADVASGEVEPPPLLSSWSPGKHAGDRRPAGPGMVPAPCHK